MEHHISKSKETTGEERPSQRSSSTVRRAVILAAGVGSRLRPFTDEQPKCLVPVNGVPVLVNTLTHLADAGIRETIIVVGHLKEEIFKRIGTRFKGMKIIYVVSEDYATTNNIYSLWLAREYLNEAILLLEADVFFEQNLVQRLLDGEGENRMAVARHQPWMSGTVARLGEQGGIKALIESRSQGLNFDYSDTFKTVNIYRFGGDFLRDSFLPRLDASIAGNNVNDYYEAILCELCSQDDIVLTPVLCDDIKWMEIDNQDDLAAANYLFASQEQRYQHISSLYGDYWRYDFVDHALLYNFYFPPEAVLNDFTNHLRDLVLNYPSAQNVLAELMGRLINQPPERIIVANGTSELIKIIGRRLKRRLIVPVPSFNEWVNAVPEGLVTESVIQPPSFQLDVERLAREAVDNGSDIAIVLNPNNPSSLMVPKSDLVWLVKRLGEKNILLIVDESFIDFVENADEITMEAEIGHYKNLVVVKSLSKCCGIGGLRLGYLLTDNNQFAAAVREELPIWNINGFAEAFLRLAPRYQKEFTLSCDLVRDDRDNLYQGLCTISGLTVYQPDANFVLCRLPDDVISGPQLTRKLFINDNILIKHCVGKAMPEADRYLRISSRTQPENQILIEALRKIMETSRTEQTTRFS